jgi:hypothetical protein
MRFSERRNQFVVNISRQQAGVIPNDEVQMIPCRTRRNSIQKILSTNVLRLGVTQVCAFTVVWDVRFLPAVEGYLLFITTWRWRQHVPSKRWLMSISQHGVTLLKTVIFKFMTFEMTKLSTTRRILFYRAWAQVMYASCIEAKHADLCCNRKYEVDFWQRTAHPSTNKCHSKIFVTFVNILH